MLDAARKILVGGFEKENEHFCPMDFALVEDVSIDMLGEDVLVAHRRRQSTHKSFDVKKERGFVSVKKEGKCDTATK